MNTVDTGKVFTIGEAPHKAHRTTHANSCTLTPHQQHQLLDLFASEEHVTLE